MPTVQQVRIGRSVQEFSQGDEMKMREEIEQRILNNYRSQTMNPLNRSEAVLVSCFASVLADVHESRLIAQPRVDGACAEHPAVVCACEQPADQPPKLARLEAFMRDSGYHEKSSMWTGCVMDEARADLADAVAAAESKIAKLLDLARLLAVTGSGEPRDRAIALIAEIESEIK
jgi:hypothetical protein